MQFRLEFLGRAGVECVAIIELAVDRRQGDCSSGIGGDPFEDLSEQAERVEGRKGIDLVVPRERGVEDDAEVASVVGCWGG